jgi:hypothetical protein
MDKLKELSDAWTAAARILVLARQRCHEADAAREVAIEVHRKAKQAYIDAHDAMDTEEEGKV